MKKIIALIVAMLMVVALVGCNSKSSSADTPDKVVKAYFDALKAKDYEKAYTLWKTDKSKTEWVNAKKQSQMVYDKYEVQKPKITGNKAEVQVLIEGFPMPYTVEKINGAWKITGYAMGATSGTGTGTGTPGTNPHAGGAATGGTSTGGTNTPATGGNAANQAK